MDGRKVSDLPWEAGRNQVVLLVQPTNTLQKRAWELEKASSVRDMIEFVDFTLKLKLCHLGWLEIYSYDPEGSRPMSIEPCGGELIITPNFPEGHRPQKIKKNKGRLYVNCTNPQCGLELGICSSAEEVDNIMFYLMLKQMIPQARFCNFIDCGATLDEDFPLAYADPIDQRARLSQLRGLGLVSLQTKFFWGFRSQENPLCWDIFPLGYILMPGMNTVEDPGIFDSWLKRLHKLRVERIKEKTDLTMYKLLKGWVDLDADESKPSLHEQLTLFEENIKDVYKDMSPLLKGPKPAPKSRHL